METPNVSTPKKPKPKTPPEDLTAYMRREVGDRLKKLRKHSKMTTAEIAAECGLGINTIFRIFSGTNETTFAGLARLANCFGVEVGDLFPPSAHVIKQRRIIGE